jgi:hypothetical protein
MRRQLLPLIILGAASLSFALKEGDPPAAAKLLDTQMIWGRAQHNDSADLLIWRERWFCAFREAGSSAADGGTVRVLSSPDGIRWQPTAEVSQSGAVLRNPRLSTTRYEQLLLTAEAVNGDSHATLGWTSVDGRDWTLLPSPVCQGVRLGRVVWNLNHAYSFGLSASAEEPVKMFTTGDGERFSIHSESAFPEHRRDEPALLFLRDGSGLSLMPSGPKGKAQMGTARTPYRGWVWTGLDRGLMSATALELEDRRVVVAGYSPGDERLEVWWLDASRGALTGIIQLQAKGARSAPGLAFQEGLLWICYDSSHEGRAMIYLTRVKLPSLSEVNRPSGGPRGQSADGAALAPRAKAQESTVQR